MTIETYVLDQQGRPIIPESPNSTLDYYWDWSAWLDAMSDAIVSIKVTGVGCIVAGSSFTGGMVKAWVGGGTAYFPASINCQITTAGGRTDDRTVYPKMVPR